MWSKMLTKIISFQRWEPKAADKPALEREKSFRAVVAMAKKVESQSDKWTESNGQSTDVQDSATFLPEATIEVQLAPRNEIKANATLPTDSKSEDVSAGSLNFTVPKSPEWAEVPIKTIPLIKTSVSLAADSKKSFEEGGKETISINPPHLYPERLQTGTKQELVPQAFGKQDTGSQYAAVSSDELKTSYTIEQSTVEGPSSTIVERKLTCVAPRSVQEGLPKLAPVRLRSIDAKSLEAVQDEYASGMKKSVESSSPGNVAGTANAIPFGLGSYLDVPVGQDVSSSGSRRIPASARPSVSHGIVEDQSELLSGFATAGDVQSESAVEYADECWDSDTYEDDDDPGYLRQPIEDEEWFLAHEIDYPSDDERARPNEEAARSSRREKDYEKYEKDEEEGCSVLEEEIADATRILDPDQFDRQLLGAVNVPLMDSDTRWRNFDASKGIQSEEEGVKKPDHGRAVLNNHVFVVEDDRMGSVRFGGVGVSSDVADFGSERRQSVPGESGEGDLDIGEIGDRSMGQTRLSPQLRNSARGKAHESESNRKQDEEEEEEDLILKYYNNPWASHKRRGVEREVSTLDILHLPNSEKENSTMEKVSNVGEGRRHKESETAGTTGFGGFSFPSPSTSGGDIGAVSRVDSGKSLWSVRDITGQMLGEEADYGNGVSEPDDPLASWRRKSNESSPMLSPRNDGHRDLSVRSTGSASSTAGYGSTVAKDENAGEGDDEVEQDVEEEDTLEVHQKIRDTEAVAAEDEEAAAVQEQIRRIRAEEEEFETFDLKIIHRKNRTGFEEDKDFPVVINAVVAGRYHVTEYLGSAAFSTAIQAHDLLTGMDVCMKIIKNNKDFFDQSLDEIKLLKYINKHDPGDKHHLLRLYDYFYHREHLFIVCELLRANLYEFHKYNRESGGEVYFTMPRLQSIARQCLEALEFIHSLGLIHCDLKPENILVKSYSRCEIKVIDLGSSCFQTDHLCPYVQSRSYRAPEVILGLPYDHKIDMWSLGCILAELCSGNVLFQNDSLATLLARVVGILGPIEPELLSKGRDTHKFFTKNHTLYERNQDSDQLEYLLPKKTSLAHRLPMGDQGFVEFVGYLLNINPLLRPNASEALKHPWLLFPYEPISS
uniref:Protein kinase domain-containing protein n=1 Tax=Physcomitrium patens TaxID=3218 RepID=A0A7I4D980_PHYPA